MTKMKAICSSETSVDFQRTTLLCIPEDTVELSSGYLSEDNSSQTEGGEETMLLMSWGDRLEVISSS
jgi:hypothetical protein